MPFFNQYRLTAPVNFGAFILFLITLILSLGLILAYVMIMYIAVMKANTSQGIKLTFCTGAAIPIAFMPDYMVKILKLTPFYYMENVSFNIYNGYIADGQEIFKIIVLQILWLIVLTILGKKLMNRQLSKIVVQGG